MFKKLQTQPLISGNNCPGTKIVSQICYNSQDDSMKKILIFTTVGIGSLFLIILIIVFIRAKSSSTATTTAVVK